MNPGPGQQPQQSISVDLRHEEENFCVAVYRFLVVVVWGRDICGADVERLGEVQRTVVEEFGHCAVASVVRSDFKLNVGDAVRKGAERNLKEMAEVTLATVLVVESGGLRASVVRSVITGVHLVARTKVPQKVFNDIGDALRWVVTRPGADSLVDGTEVDVGMVIDAVHTLADRYGG